MKHPAAAPADRPTAIATGALIGLTGVVTLVMIMHHPVVHSHDIGGAIAGIRAQAGMDRMVHGVIAVMSATMTAAMLWFAARLGLARPAVLGGVVAIGLGCVFICLAVMIDGFVTPTVAEMCPDAAAACAGSARTMLALGGVQIENLTRFALVASAASALLLGAELAWRGGVARLAGLVGLVSGAGQVWLIFATTDRLTPHSLLPIVAAQAVWQLAVAALMIAGRGPFATEDVESPPVD